MSKLSLPPLPHEDLDHVLSHTEGLWDDLRGQRIFITGGTGFFGIWLLESLVHANHLLGLNVEAVVLSRNPAAFLAKLPHLASEPCLKFIEGDVRSFQFPEGRFSHVIHAATEARAKLSEESPLVKLDTIVHGTRRVLDFCIQAGVRKLLFTSSGAIYGSQPSDLTHIPEDYTGAPDPLDPLSAYGEGKRMAEHLCVLYARQHGFEAKIARCFAFVGPHLPFDTHFAIGNFIRDTLNGGPIHLNGDGTPRRSYLYAADLAIWLWTILFRGQSGRAYNVGSDVDLSIAEVGATVIDALRTDTHMIIAQSSCRGAAISRYVPSVNRAKRELGLVGHKPLADAVRCTAKWHQKSVNPQ